MAEEQLGDAQSGATPASGGTATTPAAEPDWKAKYTGLQSALAKRGWVSVADLPAADAYRQLAGQLTAQTADLAAMQKQVEKLQGFETDLELARGELAGHSVRQRKIDLLLTHAPELAAFRDAITTVDDEGLEADAASAAQLAAIQTFKANLDGYVAARTAPAPAGSGRVVPPAPGGAPPAGGTRSLQDQLDEALTAWRDGAVTGVPDLAARRQKYWELQQQQIKVTGKDPFAMPVNAGAASDFQMPVA